MDVREKLEVIAHLGDHITYREDICICYDSDLAKVIEDAYMELKNGATVQQWISVKDRLPEVRQRILVYCESKTIEKHVTCCTYMGGYLGREQFSRHVRKVTHWMPLPEPPKGE